MRVYRYMTSLDVCHLLYSPGSVTLARSVPAVMSGGADFVGNQYLYRFRLPDVEMGRERVYTLGSKGRNFLESELGVSASWYFRPEKVRHLSYGQIMHSLVPPRYSLPPSMSPSALDLDAIGASTRLARTIALHLAVAAETYGIVTAPVTTISCATLANRS